MFSVSSSTCSTCSVPSKEGLNTIKLDIVLTNKGLQIYGTWSKKKLLKLLTNRLRQCVTAQSNILKKISYDSVNNTRLWMTIYSGLYSTRTLKKLQNKGMSIHSIIKAMKLGLISLNHCELLYFRDFQIKPYILEFKEMWMKTFSDKLILNLRPTGLSEMECWNIIVYGVALQNPAVLRYLILSGIDVPGILNWQSPINLASPKIIEFLRHIGIEENDIQLVQQYGIDEEAEQMLVDLGLNEMKEISLNMEEIICECSLTILEPVSSNLQIMEKICKSCSCKSSSSYTNIPNDFGICNCQCHILAQNKTESEMNAQRNDYLRQNIMVPLTWAVAKTLKYKPTDPIHFIAYQLLRWIHGNIPQDKKDNLHQLFAISTIVMDRKLIAKKYIEEEELIRIENQEAMENIPCDICWDRQELYRIKKRCWKCVKRPLRKFESCEFPHICSSCKINVSNDLSLHHTLEEIINEQKCC